VGGYVCIDMRIRDHLALIHLVLGESALYAPLLVSPDDDSNNKFI
jgi:hypothetical protein